MFATEPTQKSQRSSLEDAAAAQLSHGAAGGRARAKNLTAEQRSESARKAANERWKDLAGCDCGACVRCKSRQYQREYQRKYRADRRKGVEGK